MPVHTEAKIKGFILSLLEFQTLLMFFHQGMYFSPQSTHQRLLNKIANETSINLNGHML